MFSHNVPYRICSRLCSDKVLQSHMVQCFQNLSRDKCMSVFTTRQHWCIMYSFRGLCVRWVSLSGFGCWRQQQLRLQSESYMCSTCNTHRKRWNDSNHHNFLQQAPVRLTKRRYSLFLLLAWNELKWQTLLQAVDVVNSCVLMLISKLTYSICTV